MITWTAISLWVADKLGWLTSHWRIVVYGVLAIAIITFGAVVYRSCKPQPKLDEKEIREAQTAVEQRNDEKLKEILANSDAKVEGVDANVKAVDANANKVVEDAKKRYSEMNTSELQAEIERRRNGN